MKKTIWIVALVLAALTIFGVGAVLAQDETPPYGGHGSMMNGDGPLHTFMVTEWAKKLDLNVNDINTRLAAGESMYDIALSTGATAEDYSTLMTEVRTSALNTAVAANVLTQEQADQMLSHRQGGMHGTGNCDGTGIQSGSHGMMNGSQHGMMGNGQGQPQPNP